MKLSAKIVDQFCSVLFPFCLLGFFFRLSRDLGAEQLRFSRFQLNLSLHFYSTLDFLAIVYDPRFDLHKLILDLNMELTEKIETSTYWSIQLYIMFGPRLGCTHSICLANWHDGCSLCEGPLGFDNENTENINKCMISYCRWLVELGRLSQE